MCEGITNLSTESQWFLEYLLKSLGNNYLSGKNIYWGQSKEIMLHEKFYPR